MENDSAEHHEPGARGAAPRWALGAAWILVAVALMALHGAVLKLSPCFSLHGSAAREPVARLTLLLVAAGGVYLLAVFLLRPAEGRWWGPFVFAVGLALRLLMWPTSPILEDDVYRYLWDGAVTASGANPYARSPEDARRAACAAAGPASPRLRRLRAEGAETLAAVNHPHLRTIYPPVAQAAFALAHWLKPWSLNAWRCVMLLFDVAGLALLWRILRRMNLPVALALIYWWNPLAVKEFYNSGHMDVLLMPFLLGALYCAVRSWPVRASALLAFAVGVKVWPVILLPILLRPWWGQPRRFIPAAMVFLVLVGALLMPVAVSELDASSGFIAYGARWEMNDALFMAFHEPLKALARMGGGTDAGFRLAALGARAIAGGALLAAVAALAWPPVRGHDDLARRCLLATAALFMLSPTQFPWYGLWLLPFLAVCPRRSLLLLTALLPLYYLLFRFETAGRANLFHYGVVWLEFAPVWCVFYVEWRRGRSVAPALMEGAA